MITFKKIFMILYMFAFIYNPPGLIPFRPIHCLALFSIIYLFLKYKNLTLHLIKSKELSIFTCFILFLVVYSIFVDGSSVQGVNISSRLVEYITAYNLISIIIEVIPCALLVSIFYVSQRFNRHDLYNIILGIGMLQVLMVFITFFVPNIRDWIITNAAQQGWYEIYDTVNTFRMYGLATEYTFSMPLFLGMCIIISYVLACYKSINYFLLIPLFIFSIAVNARIGLISLLIAPIVMLLIDFRKNIIRQTVGLSFICITILCFILVIDYNVKSSVSFNSWTWLHEGYQEILDYSKGHSDGNIYTLTDLMWFLPDGFDLLLGTGEYVFGKSFQSSDIGYIINLFYGGLVYSALLYGSYVWLIIKCTNGDIIEKIINVSVLIFLFCANFKGNIFSNNELIRGVFVIIIFSITQRALSNYQIPQVNDRIV